MIANERRRKIYDHINRLGAARIAQLVEQLGVSEMTIHRDLNQMAQEGLIEKVHGGAVAKHITEIPYHERSVRQQREKQLIARQASNLVRAGQTIYLSPGTTMTELARVLPSQNLKIITNSLPLANELTHSSENEIVLTGGTVRRYAEALVGKGAQSIFESEYIHLAFISVTGINLAQGLSVYSESEADILRHAIKLARKTVLAADSSKFDHYMGPVVLPLDAVHVVISDNNMPEHYRNYCQLKDIDLIIV